MARRGLLGLGMATLGVGLTGGNALANIAKPTGERSLAFLNLHTGETFKAVYWEAGTYVSDALSAVSNVLRDFRTGDRHPIDVRLLDTLAALTARLDVRGPVQVISGYRSPASNRALRARSGEVAKRSLHMDGKAIDIRLPGRDLKDVRRAALDLGRGGVGFYPVSNFVHVDVGPVRAWSGA